MGLRPGDVTSFAGPVILRAGGQSGRFPMLEDLQGRSPLERRMRSLANVLDSVLFSQQLGLLH